MQRNSLFHISGAAAHHDSIKLARYLQILTFECNNVLGGNGCCDSVMLCNHRLSSWINTSCTHILWLQVDENNGNHPFYHPRRVNSVTGTTIAPSLSAISVVSHSSIELALHLFGSAAFVQTKTPPLSLFKEVRTKKFVRKKVGNKKNP